MMSVQLAPGTLRLAFEMLDRLVDLRERGRAHLPTAASRVAGQRDDMSGTIIDHLAAAQALLDLGLGHLEVPGGQVRDVLQWMADEYVEAMTPRVLTMLRRWQRSGWIEDVG